MKLGFRRSLNLNVKNFNNSITSNEKGTCVTDGLSEQIMKKFLRYIKISISTLQFLLMYNDMYNFEQSPKL